MLDYCTNFCKDPSLVTKICRAGRIFKFKTKSAHWNNDKQIHSADWYISWAQVTVFIKTWHLWTSFFFYLQTEIREYFGTASPINTQDSDTCRKYLSRVGVMTIKFGKIVRRTWSVQIKSQNPIYKTHCVILFLQNNFSENRECRSISVNTHNGHTSTWM